ncbi:MAG: flagellar biosynthetic protein FliO, partial [Planctomycetes bacterium]|nr:flagellar biosynthetic protein FliO [Planctomycetota bacterium]
TLQAIGAIIIIAGLGIGGVILVRKYAPGVIPGTDLRMKVLMRIPIGNRQNLIIVRIGERVLVVGSSPGRVECLSVVTDFEEVQKLSYGFDFSSEMARVQTETQENEISGADPSDSQDVSNEIQWLRDRLDGYGDRVEGETQV